MLNHLSVKRQIWSVGIKVESTNEAVHLNLEKRQRSPKSFPKESSLRKHKLAVGFSPIRVLHHQRILLQQRS
jgi:hypothetical protein